MGYVGDQLILLDMLWLKFRLFHESSEVRKKNSVNRRVGVRYGPLNESIKATEMKTKGLEFAPKVNESGSLCGVFRLFRDHTRMFHSFVATGVGK